MDTQTLPYWNSLVVFIQYPPLPVCHTFLCIAGTGLYLIFWFEMHWHWHMHMLFSFRNEFCVQAQGGIWTHNLGYGTAPALDESSTLTIQPQRQPQKKLFHSWGRLQFSSSTPLPVCDTFLCIDGTGLYIFVWFWNALALTYAYAFQL